MAKTVVRTFIFFLDSRIQGSRMQKLILITNSEPNLNFIVCAIHHHIFFISCHTSLNHSETDFLIYFFVWHYSEYV